MKEFFTEIYPYNALVNAKILDVISQHPSKVTSRIREVVSHVLLVHQSWNNRMRGESAAMDLWKPLPPEQWSSLNEANTMMSLTIIGQNRLQDLFTYHNTKGVAFSNKFQDVLFHVINHSSYHRGQINAELRRAGVEPVITEYIFYKR
jgi:uncharacterized damage-inducible protein DinB